MAVVGLGRGARRGSMSYVATVQAHDMRPARRRGAGRDGAGAVTAYTCNLVRRGARDRELQNLIL